VRMISLLSTMTPRTPRPTLFPYTTLFRSGHQLIMKTVVERARATSAVPTVITFEPHPRAVLHPESAPPLLQTFDQKIEALGVLRSEEHTSELQSRGHLVCRLLLEKKN